MFSIKSTIMASLVLAAAIAPVMSGSASAASNDCTVSAVRPNIGDVISKGDKFTQKDGRAYIKVVVDGNKTCDKTVTLESWKATGPSENKPYRQEDMYRYTTKNLDAGTHLLSIKLPNCYYLVDLVHGGNTTDPIQAPRFDGRRIEVARGGDKACTATTPDTPETPGVTDTTVAASSTTKTLPKTGPGVAVAGIFGSVSSLGTTVHYFVRRKLHV